MSDIPWLHPHDHTFPPTDSALLEPNGLLAVGGDLDPQRLISAYKQGIFPWFEDSQPILWWSPSPRTVLFPNSVKVSRSLKKRIKRANYKITSDKVFSSVMKSCANVTRKDQNGTWITNPMVEAYTALYNMGVAHSVEVWYDNELAGGLYGVSIGRVFFGESMFSRQTDSSKLALVHLAEQLHNWGFALIDCQVSNPHLFSLGAEEIDRDRFTGILKDNIGLEGPATWQISSDVG